MPKLVKDGAIAEDTWTVFAKPENDATPINIPLGQVILPYSLWNAHKAELATRNDLGIWLDSDETADLIGSDVNKFPVIGLNFPTFMDGRAFSTARLLRERYGYTGELRALGNFIRDQLCYLRRCGVNAFAFANPDANLEAAIKSLDDFQEYYQASTDQPLPLFRRRGQLNY